MHPPYKLMKWNNNSKEIKLHSASLKGGIISFGFCADCSHWYCDLGITWCDWADHHRFFTACHESKAKHRVPSHLHLPGHRWHKLVPVQANLLQGAALGHVTVRKRRKMGFYSSRPALLVYFLMLCVKLFFAVSIWNNYYYYYFLTF